jgi:hypothetical protein
MPNSIDDFEEKLDQKLEQRMNSRNREFWYIQGSSPDLKGRMRSFLLGPYNEYAKADAIANSKRLTSYSIINLETSDLGKASQVIKARRLHSGTDISQIFERTRHKNVGQADTI